MNLRISRKYRDSRRFFHDRFKQYIGDFISECFNNKVAGYSTIFKSNLYYFTNCIAHLKISTLLQNIKPVTKCTNILIKWLNIFHMFLLLSLVVLSHTLRL